MLKLSFAAVDLPVNANTVRTRPGRCVTVCFPPAAHRHDEQHQELRVPGVRPRAELPGVSGPPPPHPLRGPPLQLRRVRDTLHRHGQPQQVRP